MADKKNTKKFHGKKDDYPRRGKTKNNKAKDKIRETNLPEHDTSTDNDISYWNGAGQLFLDATNISTYYPIGAKVESPYFGTPYYTPAGIARYDFIPHFGDIHSSTHPLNTTAKIIYQAINSKNSRNPSYDPSDLMLYIIGVAQAWSIHAWIQRLVGMYSTFSVNNRYWWQAVCKTMGVKEVDSVNDVVAWRSLANRIALLLNRLPVPVGIPYFDRVQWMNRNIYMDSAVSKASLYYFSSAAVLAWDYDSDQIGRLVPIKTPWYIAAKSGTDGVTVDDVEQFFFTVTQNLFNDSDVPTIGADIMRAFDGKIYGLPSIEPGFALAPSFNPEVNLELHNARIHYGGEVLINEPGEGSDDRRYIIHQDMNHNVLETNRVIWDMPAVVSTALAATDMKGNRGIAVDFPIDNPTNADWMLATRLTWCATQPDPAHSNNWADIHCCCEMLINDTLYEFTSSSGNWEIDGLSECSTLKAKTTATSLTEFITRMERVSKFHDSPITFYVTDNGMFKSPGYMAIVSDLSNYCTLSPANLCNMHDVAQISIFLPDWLRNTVIR